jgi:hypothetical protein
MNADLEAKIRHELHIVIHILQRHLFNNNETQRNDVSLGVNDNNQMCTHFEIGSTCLHFHGGESKVSRRLSNLQREAKIW